MADLINAVHCDDPPIEVVEVTNPRIDSSDVTGKYVVINILVRDQHSHCYNI